MALFPFRMSTHKEGPLSLQITRYQDYSADSALAPSSMLQLSITAEVVVQVLP